ncbi:hypothetical protein FIU85_21360 (plasmid) [Roseovarius sp. THAF8]|nr:hypothetical protein FIU85_21360 [Roseovarius sp. THAF8]
MKQVLRITCLEAWNDPALTAVPTTQIEKDTIQ